MEKDIKKENYEKLKEELIESLNSGISEFKV